MKTYFVSSDIHGFYKEYITSLKEAGFDKTNNEHILIILGDIFDRGSEPWKIYKFLSSFPKERVILIKGNHEYLLLELLRRKFPFDYDISNGTYGTLISLHKDPWLIRDAFTDDNPDYFSNHELFKKGEEILRNEEAKLYDNKKINEIATWLKSDRWINYYELGKYIFVHSFIPLIHGQYFSSWRDCIDNSMWEDASWHCPYELYLKGLFKEEENKGKILVCGHWHTSDFYNHLLYKNEPSKKMNIRTENPIFKSDLYPNLIALDACTVLTKKVNVLILKETDL